MFQNNKILSFIFALLFLSSFISFFSASGEVYHPIDGTTTVYNWDFTGYDAVGVLNEEHVDLLTEEEPEIIMIENPTYAEFTITYNTFNGFLEESIEVIMHSDTETFEASPSYLINITDRSYVNEEGEINGAGAANGYINPNDVTIGNIVFVGQDKTIVVSKENLTVLGDSRAAWRLEGYQDSEYCNSTYYYDVETGILISLKLETEDSSIGGLVEKSVNPLTKESYITENNIKIQEQLLTATNAWSNDFNNENKSPYIDFNLLILVLPIPVIIRKIKN